MNKFKSIGIVLYDDFNSLDVTGPYQVFYWLNTFMKDQFDLYLIGPKKNKTVQSREGIQWVCATGYEDAPKHLDLIMVPGGNGPGFEGLVANKDPKYHPFYDLLHSRAKNAKLICSVCVGALPLAKSGLLKGYTCTTHWALKNELARYPEVLVAPGFPRYIIDRNRITGGGVSAGIDEALAIAEIIGGAEIARQIQLIIQYAPNPPFNSGDPSVASATTLYTVSVGL